MTTILDLLARRGIKIRKASNAKGGEYSSSCPGCGGVDRHGDPSDRFRIWPEQHEGSGGYWCRQCKRGGDVIQFLRDFDGLTFREACERLGRPVPDSRDLTMRAPSLPSAGRRDPKTHVSPEALWKEKAVAFTWWAHEQLFAHPDQLRFLQEARGLTVDTISAFGLGWNSGKDGRDFFRPRESWGLMEVQNEETGKPRRLWLPIGTVIPWFYKGEIWRLRIRRPDPREFGPKYYAVPGSSMGTMILPSRGADRQAGNMWVVVESELDAVLLHQEAGDVCGVMSTGSASPRPDAAASALLRNALHIMVAFNDDQGGRSNFPWWQENLRETVWHPVPRGKDPAEAWSLGVNIREWVIAGLPEGLRMMHQKVEAK